MRKLWEIAACLLAAAVLFSGCTGAGDSAAAAGAPVRPSGEVVLYCSMQEKQLRRLKAGFEAQYPEITLRYYYASTGRLLNKLAAEQQTAHVEADLVWADSLPDYIGLKEAGILTPYHSPEAAGLDPGFLEEAGYYTGARIFSFVIAYNTRLVSEEEAPKSWEALLDPRWRGQVVMADPADAGSTSCFVGAMMLDEGYGPDYFSRLRENDCVLESSTSATHARVARGDYPIGICLDYAVNTLAENGESIAGIYPETDMISVCGPIGLVADGPNPENARLLYDYILSMAGQENLAASHLRSVRSDVAQSMPELKKPSQANCMEQAALIYRYRQEVLTAFDRIFFKAGLPGNRYSGARPDSAEFFKYPR